jgi:plastocyanin
VRRALLLLTVAALAVSAVACGGSNKVGSNSLLNVKDQVQKDRLGAATTTTAPAATTTSAASLGIGRATTTAKSTETTVARELVILINSDKAGGASQFEPNSASVYTNYPVRWQNNDTVTRSVVFDGGTKPPSGDIAPGKSFTTTFASPGTYHYTDGTRPYAVASITVAAR